MTKDNMGWKRPNEIMGRQWVLSDTLFIAGQIHHRPLMGQELQMASYGPKDILAIHGPEVTMGWNHIGRPR